MFERGASPAEVARTLEVSEKSARAWRRAWADGGAEALASTGPPGPKSKLNDRQITLLPSYAPELNPVESVWSVLKRSLANLAAGTITRMSPLARTRLQRMQYVPSVVDGFPTGTGLRPP